MLKTKLFLISLNLFTNLNGSITLSQIKRSIQTKKSPSSAKSAWDIIYLKIKIILRVVVTDIGDDFPDVLHIFRQLAFFDLFPEQVA